MGGTLDVSAGQPLAVAVSVMNGAGYGLRVVTDGKVVEQRPVDETPLVERFSVTASTYIRCELVGDMPRHQLPPDVPVDVDLRDWRWALSNPIYVQW